MAQLYSYKGVLVTLAEVKKLRAKEEKEKTPKKEEEKQTPKKK